MDREGQAEIELGEQVGWVKSVWRWCGGIFKAWLGLGESACFKHGCARSEEEEGEE